jgi:hypothetical protein
LAVKILHSIPLCARIWFAFVTDNVTGVNEKWELPTFLHVGRVIRWITPYDQCKD